MWDMTFLPYSTDVEEWKGVLYKRCSGHRGEWHPECNKDYPDRMVPFSGFGMDSSSKDGLHHRCLKCDRMRVADEQRHPITNEHKRNWKHRIAKQLGGTQGTPGWKENLDEAQRLWNVDTKNHLLNTAPASEVLKFLFPETKESVITQRTVKQKSRNHTLYTMLKGLYNYTCQVEGCNETEVELAHIYKHSEDDSVDDETNAWCLCCNHHRAYDSNRMIFNPALNGRFIRYNRFGKVYEIGRIIYDEKHVIDVKWIKKAREWHDRKK